MMFSIRIYLKILNAVINYTTMSFSRKHFLATPDIFTCNQERDDMDLK